MKLKKFATAALALSLTLGGAMTSLAAGWVPSGEDWKYQWDDETYAESTWIEDQGNWYYINGDGIMATGWINVDGSRYFLTDSGQMLTGLVKIDGKVYYIDCNTGKVFTGTRFYANIPYEFTEDGLDLDSAPYVYEEWSSDGARITATKVKVINYNRGY